MGGSLHHPQRKHTHARTRTHARSLARIGSRRQQPRRRRRQQQQQQQRQREALPHRRVYTSDAALRPGRWGNGPPSVWAASCVGRVVYGPPVVAAGRRWGPYTTRTMGPLHYADDGAPTLRGRCGPYTTRTMRPLHYADDGAPTLRGRCGPYTTRSIHAAHTLPVAAAGRAVKAARSRQGLDWLVMGESTACTGQSALCCILHCRLVDRLQQ
jgi:hypothetical protein